MRETRLQGAIKRVEECRPLQVADIIGAEREVVAHLVNRPPGKKQKRGTNPEGAGTRGTSRKPLPYR